MMSATHIAFSDDSRHVDGRFNSLAVVSLEYRNFSEIQHGFIEILKSSDITEEFKWEKLRNAKYRFAARKLIDFVFENHNKLRVDTLIWDLEDKRHKGIVSRDDAQNLVRMYYHLVSTTFSKRWHIKSTRWEWYPDKQSDVDWDTLKDCIQNKKHRCIKDFFKVNPAFQTVSIKRITPSESHNYPLIQVADLFAGMGSYSRGHYQKFRQWIDAVSGQGKLFSNEGASNFSNREKERFHVIDYFNQESKKRRLQIGLESTLGFKSHNPSVFINYWPYEPQHELDKAPVTNR